MIQAIKEHHLVLVTTDERTHRLAEMLHNMNGWLDDGLITKETYVNIHNILRNELETENLLSVVGYRDERLENQEYALRVIEFPMKSDGTIRSCVLKDNMFFLLEEETEDEAVTVYDSFGFDNKTEEKGEF